MLLSGYRAVIAKAATVLRDRLAVTVFDATHSQEEARWFTLGTSSDGELLPVAHTYQDSEAAPANGSSPRVPLRAANVSSMRTNPDRSPP